LRFAGDIEAVECKATIIYKSDGPLDVALLQAVLPKDGRECVPIDLDESFRACTHLVPGEPVAAYGHALYGTHFKQRRPSLSVGNLSKVVSLQDRPSMLQVPNYTSNPPLLVVISRSVSDRLLVFAELRGRPRRQLWRHAA
jgi:hypothetical protein